MPTDTSEGGMVAAAIAANDAREEAGTALGNAAQERNAETECNAETGPSPGHSLRIRATLFGSTLAKVFTALDAMEMGEVLAVTTNDP